MKIREIHTDLNAFEILTALDMKGALLDSSKEDKKLSKYSFIGVNKFLSFKSKGNKYYINEIEHSGDLFKALQNLLNEYRYEGKFDIPFISGAIGYFSYDMGRILEKLPDTSFEDIEVPDCIFNFYDNIIIRDLDKGKTYITARGILKDEDSSISEIEKKILEGKKIDEVKCGEVNIENFISNIEKNAYIEKIKKLKDYIVSGDVYIANMTQRFKCKSSEDYKEIYRKLRSINKAPFSALLDFEEFQIISSSPERFLSVRDGIVETSPIKGTRRRGETKKEDDLLREELQNSEKDKSELLMIVDLERNDLSKVCKPHTVKVKELFKIEEYATVFHLVSTIVGELKDKNETVNCIKECFPGGSITGAPKIRAMEIIEELEGLKRNIYTGAIGYFDFNGNCDFNIAIRTIVKKGDECFFGVGGGITIESNEEEEYIETLDKAKALMRVLS